MKKIIPLFALLLIFISGKSQTITSFPYFTGFEGVQGTLNANYPAGWTSEDLNTNSFGNASWEIIKNSTTSVNARTDSTAINILSNSQQPNNDWLYTPGIQMEEGATYTLKFWYSVKQFLTSSEKLKIHIGVDTIYTEMDTVALWENDSIINTNYQEAIVEYVAETSGVYYFGFHGYSDDFQFVLLVDDVTIEEEKPVIDGIEEDFNHSVKAYPNPCDQYLNIDIKDLEGNKNIQVYNNLGELLLNENTLSKEYIINTQNFENGMYNVRVRSEKNNLNYSTVVIQH